MLQKRAESKKERSGNSNKRYKTVRNFVSLIWIFSALLFSCKNGSNSENTSGTNEKKEMAKVEDSLQVWKPLPGTKIASPLEVTGKARGFWYFEGSFVITLVDKNNREITTGIAKAQDSWMTEDWVEFSASLQFEAPQSKEGFLIFEKANPSGKPEFDGSLKVPITFDR